MTCTPVDLPGGGKAIACDRKRKPKPRKEVSLEEIQAAGAAARAHPLHPWSTQQLRERLVAAGATFNLVGIADCPVEKRKSLVSDYEHHPSWWKAKIAFCVALPARDDLTYTELSGACEALGWPRPSHIDDAGRLALFALLDDRTGPLWDQIRMLRSPAPAPASSPPTTTGVVLFHQERPAGDLHTWHRLHPAIGDCWLFPSMWKWTVEAWQPVTVKDRTIPEAGHLRIRADGPGGKVYETFMERDGFARSLICAHLIAPIVVHSDVLPAFQGVAP